jgi:hypothetical protein
VSQRCPITTPSIKNFSSFYNEKEIYINKNEHNILSYSLENPDIENNILSNKDDNISFIPGKDSFCKLCENKFQCLYLDNKGIQQNKLTYKPFKNTLDEEFLKKLGFKQDEKLRKQVDLMISYD